MSETEDYDKTATPKPHKTTHQDGGADEISVQGLDGLLADDQHVLDSEVLAVAAAKTHGALHLPNSSDPIGLPKFSAHKNGVAQTNIPSGVYTKVTFETELYDVGSKYDAPNSRWTPGIIGVVHIDACIRWTASVDQAAARIFVALNGDNYKGNVLYSPGTVATSSSVSVDIPITAITDYIEINVNQTTGVNQDLSGTASLGWFNGHVLA